jgi:hypothetical protein
MGKSVRLENEYGAEMLHWEFDSPVHRQFRKGWYIGKSGCLENSYASVMGRCRFDSCSFRQI